MAKKKITKKKKENPYEEKIGDDLNFRQKYFCDLYATREEFFGNGVTSYVEAYNVDKKKTNWYEVAAACASRLLKNVKVIAYINSILVNTGFNDAHVDKQLSFLITQQADFSTKLGAIKEFNKLKKRISDNPINVILPTPIYGGRSIKKNSSIRGGKSLKRK